MMKLHSKFDTNGFSVEIVYQEQSELILVKNN